MLRAILVVFCSILLLQSSLVEAKERVVVVIDVSAEMWHTLDQATPRIVAFRSAFDAFLDSPDLHRHDIEIGLRTMGGNRNLIDDGVCDDTEMRIAVGEIDPNVWRVTLDQFEPAGKRPLAEAIVAAAAELRAAGGGLIVVVTSGADTCDGDIPSALEFAAAIEPKIDAKIIGLALDQEAATSAAQLVPTKNVSDPLQLYQALEWAVLPNEPKAPKAPLTEFLFSRGGIPIDDSRVSFRRYLGQEITTTTLTGDRMRLRIEPGRYHATIGNDLQPQIEITGISVEPAGGLIEIDLPAAPAATLAVNPDEPLDGETIYVEFWGAPTVNSWIAVAVSGAPANEYLTRVPVSSIDGEAGLHLPPGSSQTLEARLLSDLGGGVTLVSGQAPFSVRTARATLHVPATAKSRAPITIEWKGPSIPGDHVVITPKDDTIVGHQTCVLATAGGVEIRAPVVPGVYTVRYLSSMGQTRARADLEVFEVLASVSGPKVVVPQVEMAVEWTGPGQKQDFVTVARLDSPPDKYIHWVPVSSGNPVLLRAPYAPGDFELRYIRATDGLVLASTPLEVIMERVLVSVPQKVESGTRFQVHWTGTPEKNDIIALAEIDSAPHVYIDWSYMSGGSPVILAAPFEAGEYVVRYLGGQKLEIRHHKRIRIE